MIKHTSLLLYSLLVLSFASLCPMEKNDLSIIPCDKRSKNINKKRDFNKENIKQLINKYQFDADSIYLSQLLSLTRITLKTTLTQQQQDAIRLHSSDSLNKILLILEALYLISINQDDIDDNKKLYRTLSLKFHPDKKTEPTIKKEYSDFFTEMGPILNENQSNNHLDIMIESIHRKRNEIIEQINNPSALTYAGHFFCSTALPVIGKGLGIALCHKTVAQIMPRSAEENILHDICVAKARQTALEIETKLVKLSRHL